VPRVTPEELTKSSGGEPSAVVARRVVDARARQVARQGLANARLEGAAVLDSARTDEDALALLARAMRQLALSARAYHRVLRVARTVADLAGEEAVRREHVAEAITYRQLDRRAAGEARGTIFV
jgi:magnesium chelatase family protein